MQVGRFKLCKLDDLDCASWTLYLVNIHDAKREALESPGLCRITHDVKNVGLDVWRQGFEER